MLDTLADTQGAGLERVATSYHQIGWVDGAVVGRAPSLGIRRWQSETG